MTNNFIVTKNDNNSLYNVEMVFQVGANITVGHFVSCSGGWHFRSKNNWKFDLNEMLELCQHMAKLQQSN